MSRIHTSLARLVFAASSVLFLTIPALAAAQPPTGTISGRVSDSNGGVVRGATVSITSPNLQGTQTQTTSDNGDYIFRVLPPGLYAVSVQIAGFAQVEQSVRIAPSETSTLNVTLQPAAVTETVSVVTSDDRSFTNTVQAAANLSYGLISALPTARNLNSYVNLAPGTHFSGPDRNISIQGAMSYENLFLVNGAVISDNIRSEPLDLYVEDALQEITVATSGISAEYGRFSGGVVNAVTKSGGNMFSGSFRTEFNNDNWRTVSPFGEPKTDDLSPVHSFTFGGPIRRDRIWFFAAGRFQERDTAELTAETRVPYNEAFNQQRYEGKVTFALPNTQRLQVDHLGVNQDSSDSNTAAIGADVMDLRSLVSRRDPQSLTTVNYTGTYGSSLAFEAQYSGRRWTIKDLGGSNPELTQGTPIFDQNTENSYWAPGFCGTCDDVRNNDNVFLKGSYFKSSTRGSHHVVFGYDTFNDRQKSDNRQSATDYWLYGTAANIVGADIYPVVVPESTLIVHWPVAVSSSGTNFRTHALFANDSWAVNRNLTLNLGLRFDKNSGKNSVGELVASDSLFSPRLGLVYDPAGDGKMTINASYGRYVAAVSNSIANASSPGGTPAILVYLYTGPEFNTDPAAPQLPPDQVIAQAFADFNAALADPNRDPNASYPLVQADVPGSGIRIPDGLKSPNVDEFAVGLSRQIGTRGAIRLDFVDRHYGDFYVERVDSTTGTTVDPFGNEIDVIAIENSNVNERRYTGLTFLGTYRAGARMDLGASYTLSNLRGNIEGENIGSGPISDAFLLRYPEYSEQEWTAPKGDLSGDQRHKTRIWGTFLLPTGETNLFTVGVLQQIESGTPYPASGDITMLDEYVGDLGYLNPPNTSVYFFTDRDAFRTETMSRTDVSLNYRRRFGSATRGVDAFAEFHILNLFNQFNAFNVVGADINTTVLTNDNDPNNLLAPFNPFTETPVEGTHWAKGPNFGEAVSKDAYTEPRTFRFSVGLRF